MAAAACLLLASAGCGLEPGSGLCTETEIDLPDLSVTDEAEPLTFEARLTAAGEPLVGVDLSFFVRRQDSDGEVLGVRVGTVETDADGVATLTLEGGARDLPVFRDQEVAEYSARFLLPTKLDGVQYCRSGAAADMSVPCAGRACEDDIFGEDGE